MAVWPCLQRTSQWQRHGRYLAASNRHPAKMLPALARRAIETYSDPGDLIADPMCGIGTTLVEAIHAGRPAVGVEIEPRWARLAAANVAHARDAGAPATAEVICGDARELSRLLTRRPVGLLLTSPPYGDATLGDPRAGRGSARARACEGRRLTAADRERSRRVSRACRYGQARGSLARLPYGSDLPLTAPPRSAGAAASYLTAMSEVYEACAKVIKPGGFLIVVTKNMRHRGRLRDLAADTIRCCQQAGLTYWQHVIALHARLLAGQLGVRPSFWQTQHQRRALAQGQRSCLNCHEDVLVFRAPPRPALASQRRAHGLTGSRRRAAA